MKSYAIITDIHGNSSALKAVLNDINMRKINHIYCLGDIVGIGPDSSQVIQLLLKQNNISFVQGNHDLAVVAAYYDQEPPKGHHNERQHHKWLADRLDESEIIFLKEKPKRLLIQETNGIRLLFLHYHLDENEQFLPIDDEPSLEKLNQIYDDMNNQVVCFGHHHIVHQFRDHSCVYFNPGSLGCNHKSIARYGIIHIDETTITDELIEVPYNNRKFLQSYNELEVPDREFILKVFYGV